MASKYLKNSKGIVRAITSDNLQLEKPLLNENYDIEVHNRNMDKIDSAIQEVKGKIDGLQLIASNVKMSDGTTVETTVSTNKSNISSLQTKVNNGQNHKLTHDDGRYIQTRDTGNIDNPVLGWFNYFNAKGTLPEGYSTDDNDFLVENKGVSSTWLRQTLYDVRSSNKFERMRLNGTWKDWRSL